MIKLLCILLVLISQNSLKAEDDTNCKYRNLMDDNWLKLKNSLRGGDRYIDMPAYDQWGTETCYAFAATQLVDYWRQSHGFLPDEKISLSSPIYMALVYKTAMEETRSLGGGEISKAIMALKREGLCPKEVVEQDLKNFFGTKFFYIKNTGKGTGVKIEEELLFTELTQRFFERVAFGKAQLGPMETPGQKQKPLNQVKFSDFANWAKYQTGSPAIAKLDKQTLKKIFDAFWPFYEKRDYVGFMNTVLKSCHDKKNLIPYLDQMPTPKNFKVISYDMAKEQKIVKTGAEYMEMSKNQYRDMIRSLLNRKNAPAVGIGYYNLFLYKPGTSYLKESIKAIDEGWWPDMSNFHASIIVGKREENGECQYLLKNTFNDPKICARYPGRCIYREVMNTYSQTKYKEEVGAWFNEEDILNNIIALYYIYPESAAEKEIEAKWKRIGEIYFQAGQIFKKQLKEIREKNK